MWPNATPVVYPSLQDTQVQFVGREWGLTSTTFPTTYHIIGRKREGIRAGNAHAVVRKSDGHHRIRNVNISVDEERIDESTSTGQEIRGNLVVPQNLCEK